MIQGNGSGSSRIDTYATDPAFADLTVLILSRNRPRYLERQVRWWSQTNAQILIADGSIKPNKNVQEFAAMQNKISYTNTESFAHRFLWATQRLSTKFSLITADDDLHLFSGVSASLKSLIEYEKLERV